MAYAIDDYYRPRRTDPKLVELGTLQVEEADNFADYVSALITRSGRSRNAVAYDVPCDPSYLTRICHGDRGAPMIFMTQSIAKALHLAPLERLKLLTLAGYTEIPWDPALGQLTVTLSQATPAQAAAISSTLSSILELFQTSPEPEQ